MIKEQKKKRYKIASHNPTTLSLLRSGCTVQFPSGFHMVGNIKDKTIEYGYGMFPDGSVELDKKGLKYASDRKNTYEKNLKTYNDGQQKNS